MRLGHIIGAIVIVVGGGIFAYTQLDNDTNPGTGSTTNTTTNTTTNQNRSFLQLAASSEPTKCEFTIDEENSNQTWIVYAADGKVRGDYTGTMADSGSIEGHIITDSEYQYNWATQDGTTTGTKLRLSVVQNSSATANVNTTTTLDREQEYDMVCEGWTANPAVFVPPTDVTFTDLSATLEQSTTLTDMAKQAACEACNQQADASTIEQCRTALGC